MLRQLTRQFVRQLVISVYNDNLLFWVNINFERRELNSPHKIHAPPPMILEKFNLRKQNATDFSFISLTQKFAMCL